VYDFKESASGIVYNIQVMHWPGFFFSRYMSASLNIVGLCMFFSLQKKKAKTKRTPEITAHDT
jgi:hypothetical protein